MDIAASATDPVVIDYSRNGTDAGCFTPAEVKAMQAKPDGGRRIVLAYMSIGEAEDYLFYWQKSWVEPAPLKRALGAGVTGGASEPAGTTAAAATVRIPRLTAPGWLGRENEVWGGNYHVRFWYDGWQDLMMYDNDSYLSRIQQAGFDGVYLDRVDAYYAIEEDRADAAKRMVDLVVELAKSARTRRPGFLIVPQNAEELQAVPQYVPVIDAVAKEDLLLDSGSGKQRAPEQVAGSAAHLQRAIDAGRPVLVVEHTDNAALAQSRDGLLRAGAKLSYFGTRKLDRLLPPLASRP